MRSFAGLSDRITEAVNKELMVIGLEILAEAKAKVHVISGRLKNSGGIEFRQNSVIVFFGNESVDYAAYEEFGTGAGVSVPNGYEYYAATFKGKGLKKRDGQAHAYLFPAFLRQRDTIQQRLDSVVQKVLDRIK